MLSGGKRDAIPVVCHRIQQIIQIFRVEDIPDICKKGICHPTNPASLTKQHINIVGWRITL